MITEKRKHRVVYRALRMLGIKKEMISPDTRIGEDLDFDRFEWSLFLNNLERQLKYEVDDEKLLRSQTVYHIISAI